MSEYVFVEPATLSEAQARYLALTAEVQDIDAQLSNRNRTNAAGWRLDDREWHEWRHRAVFAKRFKVDEMRRLKAWMKERYNAVDRPESRQRAMAEYDATNPLSVLAALRAAVQDMATNGVELTVREQRILDAARALLREHGVA